MLQKQWKGSGGLMRILADGRRSCGDCVISRHAPSCNCDITAAFLSTELEQQRPPSLSSSPVHPLSHIPASLFCQPDPHRSGKFYSAFGFLLHPPFWLLGRELDLSRFGSGKPQCFCWSADLILLRLTLGESSKCNTTAFFFFFFRALSQTSLTAPSSPNTPISPLAQCPDSLHCNAAAPLQPHYNREAPSGEKSTFYQTAARHKWKQRHVTLIVSQG